MYRKAKRTGHVQDWDTHSQLSKEYAKNIKRAKEKFLSSDMPSILRSNPTRFWQLLSPKYHSQSLSLTDSNKDPIVENESATALNDFFISVFTDGGLGEVASPCSLSSAIMPPIVISSTGISALIDKLKLSSSAGMDNISTKILKSTNIVSSEYLSLIFSQSLSDRQSPKDWKIGKIIPVHKSGDRSLVSNYRPISLTSVPSKLLEHIISSNIISHLNSINFFYPLQHGFRKGLSCETQLAEFTHDLLVNMNNNYQTDVIFLDFAKAFDRVPHRHLLTKLSVLGIDSTIIAWIQDFLTSRVQFTLANNHKSPLGKVASGVPQGAGLSPLLFLIYINDLPHDILSKIRLFADDCVIYRPLTNDSDHLILQDDLTQINTWCEQWLMPLNLDKCKVVSFTRRKSTDTYLYSLGGTPINTSTSYKYLGVNLTSTLSWVLHVDNIIAEASRTLGYLKRNLKSAPSHLKKLAYITFVRPKLEYASSIWHPSQAYLSDNLERIQTRAARFIASAYTHDISVTQLKETLELPLLSSRRLNSRLCLLHKFYYNYPYSHTTPLAPPDRVSSRLNHSQCIKRIAGKTLAFNTSFFPHAIAIWNSLPDDIVVITDPIRFRQEVSLHNH